MEEETKKNFFDLKKSRYNFASQNYTTVTKAKSLSKVIG